MPPPSLQPLFEKLKQIYSQLPLLINHTCNFYSFLRKMTIKKTPPIFHHTLSDTCLKDTKPIEICLFFEVLYDICCPPPTECLLSCGIKMKRLLCLKKNNQT